MCPIGIIPRVTFFMVRTAQKSAAIEETMRPQIWSYDPEANMPQVRSLDEQVNESLVPEHSQAFLLSSFGLAALLLASLGIDGVLSYSVSRRVQELGIPIALRAPRRSIYVLTMTEAARPVLAGLTGDIVVPASAVRYIREFHSPGKIKVRHLRYSVRRAFIGSTLAARLAGT
jgi:hypothetical protein